MARHGHVTQVSWLCHFSRYQYIGNKPASERQQLFDVVESSPWFGTREQSEGGDSAPITNPAARSVTFSTTPLQAHSGMLAIQYDPAPEHIREAMQVEHRHVMFTPATLSPNAVGKSQ